jgi:hypothetical protein
MASEVVGAALRLLKPRDPHVSRFVRTCMQGGRSQLTVITHAEVVCVDGVGGVEAAVVH